MLIYKFISSFIFILIIAPIYLLLSFFRPELRPRIIGFIKLLKLSTFKGKVFMFHGVSVGEIIAIEELIKNVHKEFPDYKIVITTGTNTGQEIAKSKFKDIASLTTYFPPDFPPIINRFLDKINPEKIVIAETEIWPNFSYIASKRNIPIFIINGRISDRSFKTYKHFRFFFKDILGKRYTKILTQSEQDSEKFIRIGSNPEYTTVMGNLKFDIQNTIPDIEFDKADSKILIAGSTHSGEDSIILKTYEKLKTKYSDIKLLIAPRHLTRIEEVVSLLNKTDFRFGFYSKNNSFKDCDIIILDVLGKLAKLYYYSDVAFIGGSFCKTGGHNPLEAAIFNKPVISGPNVANFKGIYKVLTDNEAGFVVKTPNEFDSYIFKLFEDNDFYQKCCNNCNKVFEDNRGAIRRVIEKLKSTY